MIRLQLFQTLDHKADTLGLSKVTAINKHLFIQRDFIFFTKLFPGSGIHRHIVYLNCIGAKLHLIGINLRIMLEYIVHIGLAHTADAVGNRVELLLFSAEIFIDDAGKAGFFHHADIHRILGENILQHQISLRTVPLFHKADRIHVGHRGCGVQHQIKFYIREVLLDGLNITLGQH